MREIDVSELTRSVRELCIEANYLIGDDVIASFDRALEKEKSPVGIEVIKDLKENARIAAEGNFPVCQDNGFAVIFVELGQEIHFTDGDFREAINEGVRQGYKDGFLRKSICDPLTRKNTGDNTPCVIHTDLVAGDQVKIRFTPKSGGSENMSRVTMLAPASGIEGVKRFIINCAREAGPDPCPPIVAGVGIGGTFEMVTLLATKSLLRPIGKPNNDFELAALEQELLTKINNLGIGPAGYGGNTTALAVHVEYHPCHIASLPVAVNMSCHASRYKEAIL